MKYLVITSSGGGGLLTTAEAVREQLPRDAQTILIDFLKDWVPFGHKAIESWNFSIRGGNLSRLSKMAEWQGAFDALTAPLIFTHALKVLMLKRIDHVYDVQPLGTRAIGNAIFLWNKVRRVYRLPSITYHKVIPDIATPLCSHFLNSIASSPNYLRSMIRIYSPPPYPQDRNATEQFWRERKIALSQVDSDRQFIRRAFLTVQLFSLQRVATLLLGSQASRSTLAYVHAIRNFERTRSQLAPASIEIRVLCGTDVFARKMAEEVTDCPPHLTIRPLSYQSAAQIAQHYAVSSLTITRAGGSTILELYATGARGRTSLIHSDCEQAPLEGMEPKWERGATIWAMHEFNAKVITVNDFIRHWIEAFPIFRDGQRFATQ